jgi:lipoate-protein ligase A
MLAEGAAPTPVVRVLEVETPALVLGSAQPDAGVDRSVAAAGGVEVVRRRSGGGAVLLMPGSQIWVDVAVPVNDPAWEPDIRRAARAIGAAWAAAVDAAGAGPAEVWEGGMRATRWSAMACFAGVGPGEVLVGSRKAVGISQRRTRWATAFQTVALLDWDPGALVGMLHFGAPGEQGRLEQELHDAAVGLGRGRREALEKAVMAALSEHFG